MGEASREELINRSPSTVKDRITSFLVMVALFAVSFLLTGLGATFIRWAGHDIDDARRMGQATVKRCTVNGPISFEGFGYYERCYAQVIWENGEIDSVSSSTLFTSADIGSVVTIGDLGKYRSGRLFARADAAYRPWLLWLGGGIFCVGASAGLWFVYVLNGYLKVLFKRIFKRN